MQIDITTIPIEEIFSETDGCPICRMRRMSEDRYVEYITGAAMMAPEMRVITNRMGFCHRHYSLMINRGPRLSNALILQSHINEVRQKAFPKKSSDPPAKANLESIRELGRTCYVCDLVEKDILHLLRTVYTSYGKDEDFRKLYGQQEFICLDHYALIMANVNKRAMDKRTFAQFCEATYALAKGYMDTLYDDVTHFASMYDYRNRGGDYGNSKDSIERSVKFLTTYPPDENLK